MTDKLRHIPDPLDLHFRLGMFHASLAQTADQMAAVHKLRSVRFRNASAAGDMDRFDPLCHHLTICTRPERDPICVARFRILAGPDEISSSYSGQFYDLTALARSGQRLVEVGRICIDEQHAQDVDVARALLAALTRITSDCAADMLIGCASLSGADPQAHGDALRYLFGRHLGPATLRPGRRAGLRHITSADGKEANQADMRHVPALLRLYLGMGGWVSDHAVCDQELDTVHVFTAVEVKAIPPARLRTLQALAQDDDAAPRPES